MTVLPRPAVTIQITAGNQSICAGTAVTFTAMPTNEGLSPIYQWKKNNLNVGTNSPTYTDATLANNDGITCVMTSNDPHAAPTTVTSNRMPMIVSPLPTIAPVLNQTLCVGNSTTALAFTGTNATEYTWTNSHPTIGLPATGTGDIAAFLATNQTQTPTTATLTVTPKHNGQIGYAYIANYNNSSISALNTMTNTIDTTIAVGLSPENIAVHPDGSRVYVVNARNNTVSVMSTVTHTLLATIPIANYSYGIAISPDGSRVYVTSELRRVSVINTTTNSLVTTLILNGNWPYGAVVSPDGNKVYVTDKHSNNISIINTTTNAITTINVGNYTRHICIRPDGNYIYAVITGYVLAVNTLTNVVTRIQVHANPAGIAANPNGRYIYVANSGSNNISVISTETHTVIETIAVGSSPQGVSVYF